MSKPDGAIIRTEGVMNLSDSIRYWQLPIYLPYQQEEFQTVYIVDGVEVKSQYVVHASDTLVIKQNFMPGNVYTDSGASGWFDVFTKPIEENHAYRKTYSGNLVNVDRYPQYTYNTHQFSVDDTPVGTDEVLAMHFKNVQTKDEDEGTLGSNPTYEVYACDSTETHLYEAGMPLSAYALMRLADNINTMAYTRQAFTVPMYAEYYEIS